MRANTRSINFTRRERRRDQLTHLEVREEALMEKKVDLDWLAMHFPAVSKQQFNCNPPLQETAARFLHFLLLWTPMFGRRLLPYYSVRHCTSLSSFKSTIKSYLILSRPLFLFNSVCVLYVSLSNYIYIYMHQVCGLYDADVVCHCKSPRLIW